MTALMPVLSPTSDTFVVGVVEYRLHSEVRLLPDEQAKLDEVVALFRGLRDRLNEIYHDVHAAVRTWMPELHVKFHAYQRMAAGYRRAQEDLIWAVQDRIGAALPLGLDVLAETPRVFVRPPTAEDGPALGVQQVAQLSGFQRRAVEARAMAMALNDAFTVESDVRVEFDLATWDRLRLVTMSTHTPTWLRDEPTARAKALEQCVNRMLTAGGIGRSMVVGGDKPQLRVLPTMLLVVTDETTYVASFAGMSGWTPDDHPAGELQAVKHVLHEIPAVRHYGLLRHLRVLPTEALQESADAKKVSGFVYTQIDVAEQRCTSDALPLEVTPAGTMVCRLKRSAPNTVFGSILTPDDLRALHSA